MEGTIQAAMQWQGEERFAVQVGDHEVALDGESVTGLSPMQYLAVGVTGCMAIDIAHILGRMRTPAENVDVQLDTERAPEPPRRFTGLTLRVSVVGDVPQKNLERAVELSRDKYCSAWHSLKDDIELRILSEVHAPEVAD